MSDQSSGENQGQGQGSPAGQPAGQAQNADMQALLGLLSEMKAEIDALKKPKEQATEPKKDVPAGTPEWAGALFSEIQALKADKVKSDIAAKRSAIASNVLASVPAPNRSTAELALKGLLADQQVGVDSDVASLTEALSRQLRASAPTLYHVPGSNRPAVQAGPDGRLDWSTVKTWEDVPSHLLAEMPNEVTQRILQGERGLSPNLPKNLFVRKSN